MKTIKFIFSILVLLTIQNISSKEISPNTIPESLRQNIREHVLDTHTRNNLKAEHVLLMEYLFYPDLIKSKRTCNSTCNQTIADIQPVLPKRTKEYVKASYTFEINEGSTSNITFDQWLINKYGKFGIKTLNDISTSSVNLLLNQITTFNTTFKTYGYDRQHDFLFNSLSVTSDYFLPQSITGFKLDSKRQTTDFVQELVYLDQLKKLNINVNSSPNTNIFDTQIYDCLLNQQHRDLFLRIKITFFGCLQNRSSRDNLTLANIVLNTTVTASEVIQTTFALTSTLRISVHSTTGETFGYSGNLYYYSPTDAWPQNHYQNYNFIYSSMSKTVADIQSGDYINLAKLKLFEPRISLKSATKNSITLTWSRKNFYPYYQIYRTGESGLLGDNDQKINTKEFIEHKIGQSITDSGLKANTDYTYYIISCKEKSADCLPFNKPSQVSDYFTFTTQPN